MNKISRDEIIENAYTFFVDFFNKKSQSYKKKKAKEFKINPFTIQATTKAIGNKIDAENMAKAIVYPFVLGTSLATSFGTRVQEFIVTTLGNQISGSAVSGMDIEYIDALDGQKKYCQVKSGPNTINYEDVTTIENHFKALSNLARTNHLNINTNDRVIGVLYGIPSDISNMYKRLEDDGYTVLVGEEFWYHLTGYENIYNDLVEAAQKAASESNMKEDIEGLIKRVKEFIETNPEIYGLDKDNK